MLGQSKERQVTADVLIESLAEDIVWRTLLTFITVWLVLDDRHRDRHVVDPLRWACFGALELLVKQRRMNKTMPLPCRLHRLCG